MLVLFEFGLINERTEPVFWFFWVIFQAIFELSQGEEDLIEDLKLAKKVSEDTVAV